MLVFLVVLVIAVGLGFTYLNSHPDVLEKSMKRVSDPAGVPSSGGQAQSLPAGTEYTCDRAVPAYAREGWHKQVGFFKAGSKLILENNADVGDMRPVRFQMEDGTLILALCKLRDLGIKPDDRRWVKVGEEHGTVNFTVPEGATPQQIQEAGDGPMRGGPPP